jgi:PKD repeat protein
LAAWRSWLSAILLLVAWPVRADPPLNDPFPGQRLEGNDLWVPAANRDATKETAEPRHAGRPGGATVWWYWSPPTNGLAVITTTNIAFNNVLAVYTGKVVFDLELEGASDSSSLGNAGFNQVQFDALHTSVYNIVIDGASGEVGDFDLHIQLYTLPVVLEHPQARSVRELENATIQVRAIGAKDLSVVPPRGLLYQWQFRPLGAADFADLPGKTNTVLGISSARKADRGEYRCVIRNGYGSTYSDAASLDVIDPPVITVPPAAAKSQSCGSHCFQVRAVGAVPMDVVWEWRSNKASLWVEVERDVTHTGQDDLCLADLSAEMAGEYRVTVSNPAGSDTSEPVVLSVQPVPPVITRQPSDTLGFVGEPASLSLMATGCPPLEIQWYWRATNAPAGDRQILSGQESPELQFPILSKADEGHYLANLLNRDGRITSREALLTVVERPENDQFQAATFIDIDCGTNFGSNLYATAEIGEVAHGGKPAQRSVWWSYQPLSNGVVTLNLAGSTLNPRLGVYLGDSLDVLKEVARGGGGASFFAYATKMYRIAVDGVDGSQGSIVLAHCLDVVGDCPKFQYEPQGFSEIGDVSGGTGCRTRELGGVAFSLNPISYRWMFNGIGIPGQTGPSLTLAALTADQAGDYALIACNSCGCVTSQVARVTVITVPRITRQPFVVAGANELCSRVDLNVQAESCLPMSYQWRLGGIPIPEATGSSLRIESVNPLTAGDYDVVVSNPNGSVTSGSVTVALNTAPAIVRTPAGATNLLCDRLVFRVGTNTCENTLFQWRHNGVPITGASGRELVLPNLTPGQQGVYDAVLTFGSQSVTSSLASVQIEIPTVTRTPAGPTYKLCERLSLEVNAPPCQNATYQWRRGGVPVVGQMSRVLNLPSLQPSDAGDYDVVVEVEGDSVASRSVRIAVDSTPVITGQPRSTTVTNCSEVALCVTVGPVPCATLSYQWSRSPLEGGPMAPIAGATASCLTLSNVEPANAGLYSVEVRNGIASVRSQEARVEVNALPGIVEPSRPSSFRVRAGDGFTNRVVALNCEHLSYQWSRDGTPVVLDGRHQTNGSGWLIVSAATPDDAGDYRCEVRNRFGVSNTATLSVRVVRPPPNDDFANSLALRGTNVVSTHYAGTPYDAGERYDNELATLQTGEPMAGGKPGGRSVWWTWRHSAPSLVTVDLRNSRPLQGAGALDTRMAIYRGDRLDALTLVAEDDHGNADGTSRVSFLAARDRDFHIQVDTAAGVEGYIEIRVSAEEIHSPPILLEEPSSVAALSGATVLFQVKAFGSPDIAYQWYRNGQPIAGQTGTNMVLRDIRGLDEANYRVTLMNEYGAVTSRIARLTFGTILRGQVTDATNTNAIPNARVLVGALETYTDANGNYELTDVYPGQLTAQFSADRTLVGLLEDPGLQNESTVTAVTLRAEKRPEFIDFEDTQFEPIPGQTVTNHIAMSPALTGMRIILNWGLEPADLDAHLLLAGTKTNYHVDYHWIPFPRPGDEPFVTFDRDARKSYGPETITFHRMIEGTYRLVVRKFDIRANGTLAASGATVKVYRTNEVMLASELVGTRHVPTDGTGDFWHVCDIDGLTKSVTWVNRLLSAQPPITSPTPLPGTVLSVNRRLAEDEAVPGLQGVSRLASLGIRGGSQQAASNPLVTAFWDLGDGNTSREWVPRHTYAAPGCYSVRLTLTQRKADGEVVNTRVRECYVMVTNGPPIVSIQAPENRRIQRAGDPIEVQVRGHDTDRVAAARGIRGVELFQVFGGMTNRLGPLGLAPGELPDPAGTNTYVGTMPGPSVEGLYTLLARATDNWGTNAWSAPVVVDVRDLHGDILILRNRDHPEVHCISNILTDTGTEIPAVSLDGQSRVRRTPVVKVLDQEGLHFDLVRGFQLILWVDAGVDDEGITANDVQVLHQAWRFGIPLYFIGENLASDSFRLLDPADRDLWVDLIRLAPTTNAVPPGVVVPQPPMIQNELFMSSWYAGIVEHFAYPHPLEDTRAIGADSQTRARMGDAEVLVRTPAEGSLDVFEPRRLTQNFLVCAGGEEESLGTRRLLLRNAVLWLLRNDCDYFGLTLTAWPEKIQGVAGQDLTLEYRLSASGACPARGVIVTNLVPAGLEIISVALRVEPEELDQGEVRQDGQMLRFGLSRLPSASTAIMEVTVRPRHGGSFRNETTCRVNFRELQIKTQDLEIDGPGPELPPLRWEARAQGLLLCVEKAPPCEARIEASDDLVHWVALGAPYVFQGERRCLDPVPWTTSFRFFRMVCP